MLDQPMYTKIVERIHDTKPQKQLSPRERKQFKESFSWKFERISESRDAEKGIGDR